MKEWIYKNNLLSFKVIHLKYIYFKSFSFLLVFLMMFIGDISFAQNANTAKIEQMQLTNDPQAKADMKALLAKYNVPSINDIWELDVTVMVKMRNDLCVYLDANTRGTYRLDTDVVALRDELGKQLASEIPDTEKKKNFKEIFAKVQQWAIKLAKTDEKLAKTDEKLAKTDEKLAKSKDELAKSKDELAKSKDELAKSKDELEEIKKVAKQYGIITDK